MATDGPTAAGCTIETPRLRLRALTQGDAGAVAFHAKDWEIARTTLLIPHPYSVDMARDFIGRAERARGAGEAYIFGLFERAGGGFVGVAGLHPEEQHGRGSVGFWVGKRHWGRGLGTEALRGLVKLGFERMGLNRVYGEYFVGNEASRRVMEKVGMVTEGVLREHVVKENSAMKYRKVLDLGVCGMLRSEWDSCWSKDVRGYKIWDSLATCQSGS